MDIENVIGINRILYLVYSGTDEEILLETDSISNTKDSISNTKWDSLPNEIKYHIISFLDNKDLYLIKL
ncbi:ankyrin repeat protein [Magpiepox virus]|nr:ankyrin repeat protein [Magpiepox virus]